MQVSQERELAALAHMTAAARRTGAPVTRQGLMALYCYTRIAGAPLHHPFSIFPTGPVSEEVLADIDTLIAANAVKNHTMDPDGAADLSLWSEGLALCGRYGAFLDEVRPVVEAVLAAIGPLSINRLRHVATMHFLALHFQREGAKDVPLSTLTEFLQAEAGEMSATMAVDFYDRLHAIRLVPIVPALPDPEQSCEPAPTECALPLPDPPRTLQTLAAG